MAGKETRIVVSGDAAAVIRGTRRDELSPREFARLLALLQTVLKRVDATCVDCDKPLGATPRGKAKRATRCKACAFNHWQASLSPAARKDRWRESKQRQREKDKANP